ncbi:hypothetical protein Scep_013965 [Stephania cephalantha]|uniref:Uncharacterized protein n=1 Tax=Stephania cephalantha TaxID=152367 RepID=A0AAP0J0E5_9MAGN
MKILAKRAFGRSWVKGLLLARLAHAKKGYVEGAHWCKGDVSATRGKVQFS